MISRRDALAAILVTPVGAAVASTNNKMEARQEEIFLEASNELLAGHSIRCSVLVDVLLHTYPESKYVPLARLLKFYAWADAYPNVNDGGRIVNEIDGYLARLDADGLRNGSDHE